MNKSGSCCNHCNYQFEFADGSDRIEVAGSHLFGRQQVRFNRQLVSDKRCLCRRCEHQFENDGHQYRVEVAMTHFWRGAIEVRLFKDGAQLAEDYTSCCYGAGESRRHFCGYLLLGFIAGLGASLLAQWLG